MTTKADIIEMVRHRDRYLIAERLIKTADAAAPEWRNASKLAVNAGKRQIVIKMLSRLGLKKREIADITGIERSLVYYYLQNMKEAPSWVKYRNFDFERALLNEWAIINAKYN